MQEVNAAEVEAYHPRNYSRIFGGGQKEREDVWAARLAALGELNSTEVPGGLLTTQTAALFPRTCDSAALGLG